MPQVEAVLSIVGFSLLDGGNQPNAAFIVVRLKPFRDRTGPADGVRTVLGQIFGGAQQIRSANVFPFNLPPIIGLSTSGGFEYQLENLEGRPPEDMASVMQGMVAAANRDPRLTRVFSTFTASNPSIWLDIDREKAQALGLSISDVFNALQTTLGGYYINDFNLFGRTWQVNIQADSVDRSDPASIYKIYVRNNRGEMVPLRSIVNARIQLGPQVISRYNNYRSVTINGSPKPGVSSGDALVAMDQLSRTTLPPGFTYEWTGTAYQEREASGQTGYILALAVLFAYLFLVALYESWMIPIPVLRLGHRRRAGRVLRNVALGPVVGPICADRHGGADRAGGKERHPDRRVRQGGAGIRPVDPRRGGDGSADADQGRADDVDRIHLRVDPTGVGDGCGDAEPAGSGHRGLRRDDRRQFDRRVPDPDALRRVPDDAGAGEAAIWRDHQASVATGVVQVTTHRGYST